MPEAIEASFPFFAAAIVPALLLMLAPSFGRRGRIALAALFGAASLLHVADMLILDHSGLATVEVVNYFPRAPEGDLYRWVTATVTAPAWHWHLFVAAMLALPAVLLFVRRDRAPGAPNPVLHGALVFVWVFCVRLGLEFTGAPAELAWGIGATPALIGILPVFGWYCGQRRHGFGAFVLMLLALAFAQRVWIVAWGWFASTRQLGTHLDTHVVTDAKGIFTSESVVFTDAEHGWTWLTLLPHFTMWVLITVGLGLVLGSLPFLLARRRAIPREVAVEEFATS